MAILDVQQASKQLTRHCDAYCDADREHSLEDRKKACAIAESSMHETAAQLGIAPGRVDGVIEMLMKGNASVRSRYSGDANKALKKIAYIAVPRRRLRALNMGIIRRANFSTPIDSQQWASPLNNSP